MQAAINAPLVERYRERIAGALTCYERIVITGTLPGACHAAGMTRFLNARHIGIFDYPQFAEPLRDHLRANAEKLVESAGARIEYIAKAHIWQEDEVAWSSRRVAIIPVWSKSFRPWEPVRPICHGTTSALGKPICARRQASVLTSARYMTKSAQNL